MFRKTRTSLISAAIIAVLVFSAVGPTIVYADGGTTDVTPTETGSSECTSSDSSACQTGDAATEAPVATEEADATEAPVATEEAAATGAPVATEEAAATEPPVATEEAAATETAVPAAGDVSVDAATPAPAAEAAPADPAPAPDTVSLDAVPQNTTVTVLNAECGKSQPLATQASADAIAQGDPIWCPAGQAPTPGANGCTGSFTSFSALLGFMSGNATSRGRVRSTWSKAITMAVSRASSLTPAPMI